MTLTPKMVFMKHAIPATVALFLLAWISFFSQAIDYQLAQVMPVVEGRLMPAASSRDFYNIEKTDEGISFGVRYYKNAGCKIVGVNWYAEDILHIPTVTTKPTPELLPHESGVQDAGRWFLRVDKLEGTTATLLSICENERLRISPFYPSDTGE